jgi:polysaccharide biosynthesis protein PslH
VRILWVTTKPPWPPNDGGRLLTATTTTALRAEGHDVEILSPRRPGSALRTLLRAARTGLPLAIARHASRAVRRQVARVVQAGGCDVVVAEQLQALPQCEPAQRAGLLVALRAQNVESDLLAAAAWPGRFGAGWLRREASHLAAFEGAAVRRARLTLALTPEDAERLGVLAGLGRGSSDGLPSVEVVPAPFPAELPEGSVRLPGDPAVVVMGSAGWRPNREGARWFVQDVWPQVRAARPAALLHVFGLGGNLEGPGIVRHPAPESSAEALAPGSILVVPLHVASGVRMKILEAWARGVPVVATAAAAAGVGAGDVLPTGADARGMASALLRLAGDPALARSLVEGGRALLRMRHDPRRIAFRIVELLLHRRWPGAELSGVVTDGGRRA